MGREIRKVPANWEHPRVDRHGRNDYQPMYDEYYLDALNKWWDNHTKWLNGTHEDFGRDPGLKERYQFYAMWDGSPPDIEYYRTINWSEEEANCFQMYETVSEGTPVSPVFASLELLSNWLVAEKGYSKQQADGFCGNGYAPSRIINNGVITDGLGKEL